jgi:hypothetical protein
MRRRERRKGAAIMSGPRNSSRPDLLLYGAGTVYLLHAVSPAGRGWIEEHVASDAPRLGTAVAVEHRCIVDIVRGAVDDGLRVR